MQDIWTWLSVGAGVGEGEIPDLDVSADFGGGERRLGIAVVD